MFECVPFFFFQKQLLIFNLFFRLCGFDEFFLLYSTALRLPTPSPPPFLQSRKHLSQSSTWPPAHLVVRIQHHHGGELINCKVKGQGWILSLHLHITKQTQNISVFSPQLLQHIQNHVLQTHYVQFCVLIFQHAQGSVSELCVCVCVFGGGGGGGNTHFLRCTPDVIFTFKPPV